MLRDQLPQSRHFEIKKLADGVFAALHTPEGLAGSNAGIIDLGNRTLVIDSTFSPEAALDLRDAAEKLTGKPVSAVFNTHRHIDHIFGNQVFRPQADVFASLPASQAIQSSVKEELQSLKNRCKEKILTLKEDLKEETDTKKREEKNEALNNLLRMAAVYPGITPFPPNVSFEEKITFFSEEHQVECISFEHAHSPGDSIAYLPEEEILFTGDLLFSGAHPYMGDADPQGWIAALNVLIDLKPKTIVPGHGKLAKLADLILITEYIQFMHTAVCKLINNGDDEAKLAEIALPDAFSHWHKEEWFVDNLNYLYKAAKTKK